MILDPLIAALRELDQGPPDARLKFATVLDQASAARPATEPPEPGELPVCRHLTAVTEMASPAPAVREIRRLRHLFSWSQNRNYLADPRTRAMLANYGYVELAGPRGLYRTNTVAFGLLLLGTHTTYPTHYHPAREVYAVIAGAARWWRPNDGCRVHAPGTLVLHEPNEPHAMETAAQPLLAAYGWDGDIHTAARITG